MQLSPRRWKEANIRPIPKVDIPVDKADFRGINITPVIARCFERKVYEIFNKEIIDEFLNDSQFAYRQGGSCVNALLKMQHVYLKALDKHENEAVRLFTMDFAKAFDNVKHDILVEKLKACPLNPHIINWYVRFLADRKQRVAYNNIICEWKLVNKGTTQGSVSGPYLFNLFLNDLVLNGHPDITLIKYADDTTIIVEVPRDLQDKSNLALEQFFSWTQNNGMSCNTAKCKELVLRKRGNSINYPIISNIKQHKSIKKLGVTIQENSKFSEHIKIKLYEANKL